MRILLSFSLLFIFHFSYPQVKIYNPDADASAVIKQGIIKAKAEGKHVLLQIGGNWCPWCIKFHEFSSKDSEIKALLEGEYVLVLINYSKENMNGIVMKSLDYPQRFGVPVFVVLDEKGNRLHTQNSAYLEEGSGYSKKKVAEFLRQWSNNALDPGNYKNLN